MSDGEPQKIEEFFMKLVQPKELEQLSRQEFEVVSNLFLEINVKRGNIAVSSTWRNGKDEKVTRLVRNFEELHLYDKLLEVIYGVTDAAVADLAIDYYNSLYVTQDLTPSLRRKYMESALADFFKFLAEGKPNKTPRALRLIDFIIDESEKDCGNVSIKSLATIRKGETLLLDIINDTFYSYDITSNNKNFNLKTTSNTTLFDVRNTLAKHLSMTWQELKINQKDELQDISNSRLMKELNIKVNEPLKVSRRVCNQQHEELIINGRLSAKAAKAFESIFDKYSTNGLMNKVECNRFIAACLNDPPTKTYDDRIANVFDKYDEDKDDQLTIKNFLEFYEDSAKDRPQTVWNNLKNCRIRADLRSVDDPDIETVQVSELPRYHLGQRVDFYEALFGLLDAE
jgi:ubiquitin carboxyl-terminal hydrolase 34